MKITSVSADRERLFLIALARNNVFAVLVKDKIQPHLFPSAYARTFAGWCKEHTAKHGNAINNGTVVYFNDWAEGVPPDEVDAMRAFLDSISEQSDSEPAENPEFLAGKFGEYMRERALLVHNESQNARIEMREFEMAYTEMDEFNRMRAVTSDMRSGWNMCSTNGPVTKAFAQPDESLISWPGELNRFLGPFCTRTGLLAIQAPEKRGKTFLCLDFAYWSFRSRRNVAFFQCGDLSQNELNRRWWSRIMGKPLRSGEIRKPISLELDVAGKIVTPRIEFVTAHYDALEQSEVGPGMGKFHRECGLDINRLHMMAECYTTGEANIQTIDNQLEFWYQTQGFIADIIIIDYMDILAPEPGANKYDYRQQVNGNWIAARRLSQKRNALVVAPTQATREAYKSNLQNAGHASEDKRKNAHVTGILAINQKDEEKEQQVMKLNWVVLRNGEYHASQCLYITQCLGLSRSICQSAFPKYH